jgi:hypothetical protein
MAEVELVGQPLIYTKNGITYGCGVRAVGVVSFSPSQTAMVKSFDVSANFWVNGAAAVKMIGALTPYEGKNPGLEKRVPLFGGWLKAEGKNPAAPGQGGFTAGSEKGSYLFPVELEGALDFILAATNDLPVQIAIAWMKNVEWIYYGKIKLTPTERNLILRCIDESMK